MGRCPTACLHSPLAVFVTDCCAHFSCLSSSLSSCFSRCAFSLSLDCCYCCWCSAARRMRAALSVKLPGYCCEFTWVCGRKHRWPIKGLENTMAALTCLLGFGTGGWSPSSCRRLPLSKKVVLHFPQRNMAIRSYKHTSMAVVKQGNSMNFVLIHTGSACSAG